MRARTCAFEGRESDEKGGRRRLRIRELELQSEGGGVGGCAFCWVFPQPPPSIPSALFFRVLPVGCSCGLPPCALHLNEPPATRSRGEGARSRRGHPLSRKPTDSAFAILRFEVERSELGLLRCPDTHLPVCPSPCDHIRQS